MIEPKPSEQYDHITIPSQEEPIPIVPPTREQQQNIAAGLTMLYDAQPDSVKQEIQEWVAQHRAEFEANQREHLRHELAFASKHPEYLE